MKKLLAILILGLFLITPSQADDISDFQIEGISIGDSVLDFISESKISKEFYPDKKYFRTIIVDSDTYDFVFATVKSNDKKYIIHAIETYIDFENNISGCLKKKKEVVDNVAEAFTNFEYNEKVGIHASDITKKSKTYQTFHEILNQGIIEISCYEMSEETNELDVLMVSIYTNKFNDYLIDEAYK